jgi:hypothetical protein
MDETSFHQLLYLMSFGRAPTATQEENTKAPYEKVSCESTSASSTLNPNPYP